MISRRVNQNGLAPILIRIDEEKYRAFAEAFDRGEPRVYYSFQDDLVIYVVFYEGEVGTAFIGVDGSPSIGEGELSPYLLRYIVEREKEEANETLMTRYGSDAPILSAFALYGPKKAKALLEASKRVDALAAQIQANHKKEDTRKPMLQFVVDYNRGAQISLRLGFTKFYLNRHTGQFLRDYLEGYPLTIQKEYLTLPPGSFNQNIEEALAFLYKKLGYYSGSYPVSLDENGFIDFLFLLQGEDITFNDEPCHIDEEAPIQLKLLGNGALACEPAIPNKGLKRAGSKLYVKEEQRIRLFRFTSKSAADVYDFFQKLGDVDGSYLADELARKVLPSLNDEDILISPEFEQAHPVYRPQIHYYIGLEEEARLSFQTEYYLGHEQTDIDTFVHSSPESGAMHEAFHAEIARLGIPASGKTEDEADLFHFLKSDLTKLMQIAKVFVSEELQKRKVVGVPELSIRTSSGEDWFSINLYSSGYTEEELLQLYNAFTRKKKFVRLRSDFVELDENDEQLRRLSESFAPADFGKELPLYQALKLPSLGSESDDKVKDLIKRVEGYADIDLQGIPEEVRKSCRPYQGMGIRFLYNLYNLKLSGILSDDMGLGKTLQSFGLFGMVQGEKPILVVCPKSLIYNWLQERDKWYPDLPAFVLVGLPAERKRLYARMAKGGKAAYFVSYDTLRNDLALVKDIEFSIVLLDEGQYIANVHALKTKAVKEIKATSRFVLTGTPIQNSLLDLWSIFDFLLPGYFPPLSKFKELYGGLEFSSEEARKRLMAKIKPFLLGRKKKDVLTELPDKENITLSLTMMDKQREVYESYLARARDLLKEETGSTMKVLSMMTRLRQICINPSLFLEGDFVSAKIDYLIEALCDLKRAGRKAIVFSSFVGALELIQKRCKEVGLQFESITGDTSAKVRVILAERFNKPDSPIDVMFVSLKAGGTGLNLIGADTVFHLDPWWNLAAERQAEDRAHRIGQVHKVTVFKLIIKDSIEEKVLSLQQRKGLLTEMADEASVESALTPEDYAFLLS